MLCRAAVLAGLAAVVLLWPMALAFLIPALSPYVALCSAAGRRAAGIAALCGVPALLIVTWRRRWLCRWACPVGLLLEGCGKARRRAGGRSRQLPPVGQWLAAATLAGAAVGLPLALWLDPLAVFTGAFQAVRWPPGLASIAPGVGLAGLLVMGVAWPGAWCRALCPLGGTQDWLADLGRLCRRGGGKGRDRTPRVRRGGVLARRLVLSGAAGAAGAAVLLRLFRGSRAPRLRPPGTVDEAALAGQCIRCGNCGRVCPTGIIHQSLALSDPAGLLTPVVRFDGGYCLEDCCACTQSCPSGAIRRLTLTEKNRQVIGRARIDLPDCLLTAEVECGHCARACPYGAIVEGFSEATWTATVRVDPARCNGCGACLRVCPPNVIAIEPDPRGHLPRGDADPARPGRG